MDSILNVEILKQTLWIYLFVFAGAGVITFVFRKTNWGRNITVATAMWFVIFVLFIFGAFFGWLPFSFIILVIAFGAVREFYILNGVYNKTSMFTASVLLLAMAAAVGMGKFHLFYYIPGLSVFVFFPLHMFRNSWNSIIGSVSKQVLGLIYWGWLPLHFLLLHRLDCGYGAIVVICSMIALNDNCAYYVGKLLGKNSKKLAPNISPNKTRTGF
ncbi:MAG: phosphatidate cytidylyltransferase, partial [bacterium]|nr:phosphatidate cytidylyltransferase [bacterium]